MRESEKRQRKERDQRRVAIAVVAAVGRRGSVPQGAQEAAVNMSQNCPAG